jgi:hypothetical protein
MSSSRQLLASAAVAVFAAAICSAQNIAPAHSGTVHYFEGDVTVDGVKLVSQVARFTELREQSELHTGLGRAEILLTPGVLLRVGENSTVKMLDNRLVSTRVEFVSGIAMVEAMDDAGSNVKDPPVTIVYKDFQAQPLHYGLFEMNSQPGQVRVFKGEARVLGNNATVTVKEGNRIDLGTTMAMAKFDAKDGDDLYLWSRDRSAYLSAANMSSARALANSGYGNAMGYSGTGMGYGPGYAYGGWNPAMWSGFSGGWYYNPYLNMVSYMPFAGTMYSPFGYGYYNPVTVVNVYTPGYYWNGAGGSRTGTTTGIPLSTLPTAGTTMRTSSAPLLPRLGVTAGAHPTLAAPTRGLEPGAPTASLTSRNSFGMNSASNSVRGAAPVALSAGAPVASAAPAAAAAAPRAAASPAGRR